MAGSWGSGPGNQTRREGNLREEETKLRVSRQFQDEFLGEEVLQEGPRGFRGIVEDVLREGPGVPSLREG